MCIMTIITKKICIELFFRFYIDCLLPEIVELLRLLVSDIRESVRIIEAQLLRNRNKSVKKLKNK